VPGLQLEQAAGVVEVSWPTMHIRSRCDLFCGNMLVSLLHYGENSRGTQAKSRGVSSLTAGCSTLFVT